MISAEYFTISSSEISTILEYLFQFALVYISCFIGTIIRDMITASRIRAKINIPNAALYSLPCAFIMATVFDTISDKAGFDVLVLACVFIGMWSREVASLLLNNKVALAVVKHITKYAIGNSSMTEEEADELTDIFDDAVGNGKKVGSDEIIEDNSALTEEDSSNCTTADSDPPESANSVDSENDDMEESVNEEDELGGDPAGEFSWIEIIGH